MSELEVPTNSGWNAWSRAKMAAQGAPWMMSSLTTSFSVAACPGFSLSMLLPLFLASAYPSEEVAAEVAVAVDSWQDVLKEG